MNYCRTKKKLYICRRKTNKHHKAMNIETTIAKLKKGDYFKFSNTPNAKVYEKLSGGKIIHKYGCVDDFCDEQTTKNSNRKVFLTDY